MSTSGGDKTRHNPSVEFLLKLLTRGVPPSRGITVRYTNETLEKVFKTATNIISAQSLMQFRIQITLREWKAVEILFWLEVLVFKL